ncbi:hypothetical protein [Methylocystis sp. S23]
MRRSIRIQRFERNMPTREKRAAIKDRSRSGLPGWGWAALLTGAVFFMAAIAFFR